MSILGKYSDNLIEDDEGFENSSSGYTLPVVIQKDEDDSLKKAITIATTSTGCAGLNLCHFIYNASSGDIFC